MTIEELRKKLDEACTCAIEKFGLKIKPGALGVVEGHPDGRGYCCPIGAFEICGMGSRYDIDGSMRDQFVYGFDGFGCYDSDAVALGHEFRKKYYLATLVSPAAGDAQQP
jgi:hypothetical protein